MMHLAITVSELPHDLANFCFFVFDVVVLLLFFVGYLLLDMLNYIFTGVDEIVPFCHLCDDCFDGILLLLLLLSLREKLVGETRRFPCSGYDIRDCLWSHLEFFGNVSMFS